MHILFIPYGNRRDVEILLRDMEAQKHILPMTKAGKKQGVWINGQIRLLPLGVYEYICPKEDKDRVLTTLDFNLDRYDLGKLKLSFLRTIFRAKKAKDFKTDKRFLWLKENVNIIPIGIKDDVFNAGSKEFPNWEHEAL